VIVTRSQFSPQYRPARLFPLFLLIFSQGTRHIAYLINFSKLCNLGQLPFSQRSSIIVWLEEAPDHRLTREQRPRLSNRAEEEDLWPVYDAVGFW
jgi:hypothetical protein